MEENENIQNNEEKNTINEENSQKQQVSAEEKQRMIDEIFAKPAYKMPEFKNTYINEEIQQKPKTSMKSKFFIFGTIGFCLLLAVTFGMGYLASYIYAKNNPVNTSYAPNTTIITTGNNKAANVTINQVEQEGTVNVSGDLSTAVATAKKSVVLVSTTLSSGSSLGSGVMFGVTTGQGGNVEYTYILTNHHVIDKHTAIAIKVLDGSVYEATLVGSDASKDIAVLKVHNMDVADVAPATLGNSSVLKEGNITIAIGNALGEGYSVSSGIVSALSKNILMDLCIFTLIQTDSAINSGNSGGGLFDMAGNLIGVVNAKSFGTGIEGMGYAIPINVAKETALSFFQNIASSGFGYSTNSVFVGLGVSNGTNCISINSKNSDTNIYSFTGATAFQQNDLIYEISSTDGTTWTLSGNDLTVSAFAAKLAELNTTDNNQFVMTIRRNTSFFGTSYFDYKVTVTLNNYVYSV